MDCGVCFEALLVVVFSFAVESSRWVVYFGVVMTGDGVSNIQRAGPSRLPPEAPYPVGVG